MLCSFLTECDEVIIPTAEAYEREALKALGSWLSEMSTPLYATGPLLPPSYANGYDATSHWQVVQGDAEFKTFLDVMLMQHGENSVVFVQCFILLTSIVAAHMTHGDFIWHRRLACSPGIHG